MTERTENPINTVPRLASLTLHIGMNDGTYVGDRQAKTSSGGGSLSKYVREDGTILSYEKPVASEEPEGEGEDA